MDLRLRIGLVILAGVLLAVTAPLPAQGPQAAIDQLGTADRTTATPQLTEAAGRFTPVELAPLQLAPAPPSAAAPEPLSQPADGRDTATPVIAGRDRCDPAAPAPRGPACSRVIETRAADYARPAATLTPEQRLLVQQQTGEAGPSADARRVAANPGDASDQAVASVVLRGPAPPPREDDKPAGPASAVIDAIVGGATQPPPR